MEHLNILLIGQPNTGKSALLNALVGPTVTVSNYPGTTVEITKATMEIDGTEIEFADTPGIYSISDRSQEEKITEMALFGEGVDGVIIVADSVSLDRSLYMALQILDAEIPAIIALNFVEEAERKGIKIDSEALGQLLSIPVIPINPLKKWGIKELAASALKIKQGTKGYKEEFDDHIEKAIKVISSQIKVTPKLPKRFIAIRVLEGDTDFYIYLENEGVIEEAQKELEEHPRVAEDISITRYGTASLLAQKVTQLTSLQKEKKVQRNLDNILLDSLWGPPATAVILLSIFAIIFILGNLFQRTLMDLTESLLSPLSSAQHSVAVQLLVWGLTGLAAGLSVALPYVFLFYLVLGLLEDMGLLSRFIINAENFLRKLGLPGKAFIPLALGVGCSVAAISATRVLACKKEQLKTASLFAFIPCSSRIAIIMGIVGYYGGIELALAVLATSFASGLIWIYAIKKVMHIKNEPLLLELPPYRKPLIKNVFTKSWIRMKSFVYIVMPLLVLGGVLCGILDLTGWSNIVVAPFAPLAAWLGLPAITTIPLILSFLQKDLTGAMLVSVLGANISAVLTPLQIYTFGVATTIGIPCIIALGMLSKEFGFKKAILITISSTGYGYLIAGLIWRVIVIFQ